MTVEHTLAVIAVSDFDKHHAWYERLFGVPATNVPMPGLLAEWRTTESGWLQLTYDPARAGASLANFAVDDLYEHLALLRERGIEPTEVVTANKDVRLGTVHDPDGNAITFIGNFRANY